MKRYICVHGHFYQPPRENPWLEAIERQESAYPYHDWNARITAECYAPNAASRIMDAQGRIGRIVNNYGQISFNFGPTLLSWLREKAPDVYGAIQEADQESRARFSGHGSALAQAFNHIIMPLASPRDQRTQVLWGMADFRHHFGRDPEGMWLPETAVDLDTLELLAEQGVAFTVLAPHQARRMREAPGEPWLDATGGKVDPTRPYVQRLPSGRTIAIFFYDGPISRAVAFERLLASGERFAGRLASGFNDEREWPQLVHIATDGETYGHHHRHGEMALSYALKHIEEEGVATLTNYGEYLERHPPTVEVDIYEDTSWSCAHGIERWKSDCGCHTGGQPGWRQAWRAPLRDALDTLRDGLEPRWEAAAAEVFADPWEARDDYVQVILDRGAAAVDAWLDRHAVRPLSHEERVRALKLLELQRHAMLMYTSCGWFFNELSGIETVQVLQYAGRALQLAEELLGSGLEEPFLERLGEARSNLPEWGTGRDIFERAVRPSRLDLEKVGAHFAVSSLFERYGEHPSIYAFKVRVARHDLDKAGAARLAVGRAEVTSTITRESADLTFAVVHFGDHNLSGGVRAYQGEEQFQGLAQEVKLAFQRADFPQLIRLLDKHFEAETYSLRSLFRDQQHRILERILESTLAEAESVYRQLYQNRAPLMRFLTDVGLPIPTSLHRAAEWVLNTTLRRSFEADRVEPERIATQLEEVAALSVPLDAAGLGYAYTRMLERLAADVREEPESIEALEQLRAGAALLAILPFDVNTWTVQNIYFELLQDTYPAMRRRGPRDEAAAAWVAVFLELGRHLYVAVPDQPEPA
ncbi:MAG TPA: DUF3536 domain-containing protein [Longimicrobiales bacterium]|nr:DUF3536 domain-containing protein [Longimicrobiales bacterium]